MVCELWAVVNNAGVIERGELEWTPLEVHRKLFEVNVFGVVSVTQAFLPLLRKFKGRVVTVTSISGRLTFSGMVPYCMSKHAAKSFCEGLRLEMKKFGVKVITVEPLAHRTGMTEISTVLKSVQDTWNKFSGKCKKDVYDENYIQAFNESILKFTEATTLPDTSRVIDSLVEAVCTVSPHYSYIPGNSEGLLNYWFSKRIPKTYLDYNIRKYITFDCDVEKYLNDKEMNKKNS
ncbi:d-beta-hydroxybutyrate dehydrogenase, mitochondrial [Trichonephila clavata]|uniref:D-beta-hydroxybutyrate dehydrogenase, mitochondrial n=1 Tax=Trichonephila clavata TaxID=2740835 RepID=A0A8X6I7Y2_TRICU|nr:d-beta-hydroxybutyrate dehydrogenase, mitochondrial [Trichonephila clavata]